MNLDSFAAVYQKQMLLGAWVRVNPAVKSQSEAGSNSDTLLWTGGGGGGG